ncbi:MAG: acyltransferase, partial [Clostridia bacterium]|nr:acyltransferase [Clostridia bacterium]
VIEDHVWVGTKVTCLKGVHVSRDSVVAATTTLCKDYNIPNVIIGGVPGKIIKTDGNWSSDRV